MERSVLLIEDDRFLSSLIKRDLIKEGYNVIQTFDGESGLEWLKANRPDIIILDLILPRTNGFDVLQAISLDPNLSSIPVLVVSNLALESDLEKARQYGVVDYFVKVKVSVGDIVSKVKSIVK